MLLPYISCQLHEYAHWVAARLLSVEVVFGFNEWNVVDAKRRVSSCPLAAGPLVTLALALVGLLLMVKTRYTLARFLLLIGNSLMGVSGALGNLGYAFTHPDSCASEPIWKLYLLPAYLPILYLGLRLCKGISKKLLATLIAATVFLATLLTAADKALQLCIDSGLLICKPVNGYPPLETLTNLAIFVTAFYLVTKWRIKMGYGEDELSPPTPRP